MFLSIVQAVTEVLNKSHFNLQMEIAPFPLQSILGMVLKSQRRPSNTTSKGSGENECVATSIRREVGISFGFTTTSWMNLVMEKLFRFPSSNHHPFL